MRLIVSVALSYAVVVALAMGGQAFAWSRLGADQALQPDRWAPSATWIVTSFGVALLAAIVGGYVCAVLGSGMRAARVLAGAMLGLGLASAVATLFSSHGAPSPPRDGEVSFLRAMQQGAQPAWVAFTNAFLGAAGALLGAQRRLAARDVSP
jgi:hypothetical protein